MSEYQQGSGGGDITGGDATTLLHPPQFTETKEEDLAKLRNFVQQRHKELMPLYKAGHTLEVAESDGILYFFVSREGHETDYRYIEDLTMDDKTFLKRMAPLKINLWKLLDLKGVDTPTDRTAVEKLGDVNSLEPGKLQKVPEAVNQKPSELNKVDKAAVSLPGLKQQATASLDASRTLDETERTKSVFTETCSVCLLKIPTHYLHPCGHKNICKSCALQYLDNSDPYEGCPWCQVKYNDVKRFNSPDVHKAQLEFLTSKIIEATLKESKNSLMSSISTSRSNINQFENLQIENPLQKTKLNQALEKKNSRSQLDFLQPTTITERQQLETKTGTTRKTKQSVASNIISTTQNYDFNNSSHSFPTENVKSKQPPVISAPKVRLLSEMSASSASEKSKSTVGFNNTSDQGRATIVFTETVNARFTNSDWTQGYANLLGKVTFNFQKDDIIAFQNNVVQITTKKFYLVNIHRLQELTVNDEWLTWLTKENKDSHCYAFEVKVNKMIDILKKKCKRDAHKNVYALEAFTYKINSMKDMKSCPLFLSTKWSSDDSKTKLKIKYKHNPVSMSSGCALKDVKVSACIESGFDHAAADPVADKWLTDENKITWNLGSINVSKSKGNILAEFKRDDEPTEFGTVAVEFKSLGNSLSGVQFRPESDFPVRDIVMRIFAGKYMCGEESST